MTAGEPIRNYDLKLADGRMVSWQGSSGEDAARRYVDCRGGAVVAWRHPRVELVIGTPQIIG